jgi:hypothetical protein
MVGDALERGGKEGQDWLLIRNQPTIFFLKKTEFPWPTPQKTTFGTPVCVSGFFGPGPGWENEGTALQYQGGSGGGRVELRFLPLPHVTSSWHL